MTENLHLFLRIDNFCVFVSTHRTKSVRVCVGYQNYILYDSLAFVHTQRKRTKNIDRAFKSQQLGYFLLRKKLTLSLDEEKENINRRTTSTTLAKKSSWSWLYDNLSDRLCIFVVCLKQASKIRSVLRDKVLHRTLKCSTSKCHAISALGHKDKNDMTSH